MKCFFFPLALFLFISSNILKATTALSLSASSRWIVNNETGQRVKLACANWPSHLQPMLAEGLDKQPLDTITNKISSMGFNCVRFTWPIFLVSNNTGNTLTVRKSFQSLNLTDALQGIQKNNPALVDLPLIEAFMRVVSTLEDNNIMVILDNHVSKPEWCCSYTDGNGFFGDQYFNPDQWIEGLTTMAALFRNASNVIGMSLRNELRGPRENVDDWYKYMQKGAEAVHAANPKVLVILSGLHNDNDLGYVANRPVQVSFNNKLVFELHWYSFSDTDAWANNNANDACGQLTRDQMRKGGFFLGKGLPLFMSEFGVDQKGYIQNDNRYLGCVVAFLAEHDLDWAIWALQGSYYLREGNLDKDEEYGVLNHDWSGPRNTSYLKIYQALQQPLRGPKISNNSAYQIILHPTTGQCVLSQGNNAGLGSCTDSKAWTYTQQQNLVLDPTQKCLKANAAGASVKLSSNCSSNSSKWVQVSSSGMHFSTGNNSLCLDVGTDGNSVVSNPCKCLGSDKNCNPESQWFKLVTSTRKQARPKQQRKLGRENHREKCGRKRLLKQRD